MNIFISYYSQKSDETELKFMVLHVNMIFSN